MLLGYNTNGLAHHDLFDAVELLAEIGYRGVAITIDHGALPPYGQLPPATARRGCGGCWSARACGRSSRPAPGSCSIRGRSTSRRWSRRTRPGRARRIDFYQYAIDCAAELGSDCVSLWSGVLRDDVPRPTRPWTGWSTGCGRCSTTRPSRAVAIGFEPEPGMFIDTMRALRGAARAASTRRHAAADARRRPPALPGRDADRRRASAAGRRGWSTSTSRTCERGVHEHLMFGEGRDRLPAGLAGARRSRLRGRRPRRTEPPQPRRPRGGAAGVEFLSSVMERLVATSK